MSKADEIYNDLIMDIYNNGQWDKGENTRTKYADGTPAYTKSIFGKQVVFEEGEIPLLTSKRVGWKTAYKEILLFWLHQTVKKEDFKKWNVNIWDEWFLNDDTLGKSYAYQFEPMESQVRNLTLVDTINKEKLPNIELNYFVDTGNGLLDSIDNKVYKNGEFGDFIIIEKLEDKKSIVQFLNTGAIKEVFNTQIGNKKDLIKDNFCRTVFGIGYYGNEENYSSLLSKKHLNHLKTLWRNMLERCYHLDKSGKYKETVFVDESWHSFEKFTNDITKLPHFFSAKRDNFYKWRLDKDYYNSNKYSKETCVWLEHWENCTYRNNTPIISINKDGKEKLHISYSEAAKYINGSRRNIEACIKGEYGTSNIYRGYQFKKYEVPKGKALRYEIMENQVIKLIESIKTNPASRRHMTSFWNINDDKNKPLKECAMQTTWSVRNGKLDLLLYSRSVDSMLGLPYNWIQYWFLLQMMAQSTGLKPGRFIHQMGNIHYYDRHENSMFKQLSSRTYEQPNFWINPSIKDFFNFTPSDVKVENYQHGERYSYEVAI